ncbi:MAG: MBL fold metallo-hydrolase [Gammaproteobacteria bacterium]
MKRIQLWSLALCALMVCVGACAASSVKTPDASDVTAQQVAPHIWYLHDRGGNMTALIGADGTLLVDDEFAPFVPAILARLKMLGSGAPKFVVNTHYHQDHTGGNAAMHAAGAVIIAQENVRSRLAEVQRAPLGGSVPAPVPASALPTITFEHSLTVNLDGEPVRIVHMPPGHTDGDSIVAFEHSNVVAMGDLFFNGIYPIIDVETGGNVDGMIADVDRALLYMNDKTVVIPGHGPVADKAALVRYRDMMIAVRDKVKKFIDEGKTLEQIQAAKPTAQFDAEWDGHGVSAERFVAELYYSMHPQFVGK